jgi:ubiquinol-cytochrome c reductase cytochrome b subunit
MAHPKAPSAFQNPFIRWVDDRLPVFTMLSKEYGVFPTPRNFNYLWNFGALAMFMLVTMIVTGIFLAMQYTPNADLAFDSVDRITRDVNFGWLLRTLHANGSSMFFAVVYIHIFRGMYYGSYKRPRELLWLFGTVIYLLMMATAFLGYTLPWGQMSFWGATVITNFFTALPFVGKAITTWLWGGFAVANPTLNRFFALHYLLPFVIAAVVFLHVWALHVTGSNNPLGIEPKSEKDTLPFHPYYTMKDLFGLSVFLVIYAAIVFYIPDYLGDPDNYIKANPLLTPASIEPEWYFLPFYAILRSVPNKLLGVILMFGAVVMLFLMPWLDTSKVRSAKFRPVYKGCFWIFVFDSLLLGLVGSQHPEGIWILLGRVGTIYYFGFFIILLPFLGWFEKTLPLPASISESVLGGGALAGAAMTAKPLEKA